MNQLVIRAGDFTFEACFEDQLAPKTCAAFRRAMIGQLAGNHFITLTSGLDRLPELGKTVLWKGAQKVRFEAV